MDWKYEQGRIYSCDEKGVLMAETTYIDKGNGEININHTYVNPILRGQGVADKMMAAVSEYLRKEGLKATATCSYAYVWLKKNSEQYPDIIARSNDNQAIACNINGKH